MTTRYYVSREWLVSDAARRTYRAAACLSLLLLALIVYLSIAEQVPGTYVPWLKLGFFLGILGAALTIVAMEYFLFTLDPSPGLKKTIWFLVMCLPLLGPFLYCFWGYSRSELFRGRAEEPERGIAARQG